MYKTNNSFGQEDKNVELCIKWLNSRFIEKRPSLQNK